MVTRWALVVREGPDAGARAEVPRGGVLLVGRSSGCGLVLRDPAVSRRHFEVSGRGRA
ncbi:MAG: FHA domain-containing protein [Polyangiaceae bacterium]